MPTTKTDDRTEQFLDSLGVKWIWDDSVDFSYLESGWDSQNLGRSKTKVKGKIIQFGNLLDQGSPAPGPILADVGGVYGVLDGISRLSALRMKSYSRFSAYIVQTRSTAIMDQIRVISNLRLQGGEQESDDWTATQAVRVLIFGHGMDISQVAESIGCKADYFRTKVKNTQCVVDIENCGGPTVNDAIAAAIIKTRGNLDLTKMPEVTKKLATILVKRNVDGAQAEQSLSEFFRGKCTYADHKLWERRLAEFNAKFQKPYSRRSAEGKFSASLATTVTTSQDLVASGDSLSGGADAYYQSLNKIRDNLKKCTEAKPCRRKKKL